MRQGGEKGGGGNKVACSCNLRSRCGPFCRFFLNMLDVPPLMSTSSTLPALFSRPHHDAKRRKEASFKGSIWLPRIFHWCIVMGHFAFPALLRRTGSETEPDVRVFTDIVLMSCCFIDNSSGMFSRPWMLRLFWRGDYNNNNNNNDHNFYGYGFNNRWGQWFKKAQGVLIIHLGEGLQRSFDLFFSACFIYLMWKPQDADF